MTSSPYHDRNNIKELLKNIPHPVTNQPLMDDPHSKVTFQIDDHICQIIIESDERYLKEMGPFCKDLEKELQAQIPHAKVLLTSHRPQPSHKHTTQPQMSGPKPIQGVKHVIAIASGKGGVGKSTTTLGLALCMAQQGYRVGILDADIYGPSLPKMMNIKEKPDVTDNKKLIPILKNKIACLSVGFMVPEDAPTIWRGPMVQSALKQLLHDVAWDHHGELDILFIDLPPGTGDIHLTLVQQAHIDGAVIVSTPQDIALIDAIKGLKMFERLEIPVLGMIENMSHFICPHCHESTPIFSQHGVEKKANELGITLLGKIPLQLNVREAGDTGLWESNILELYKPITQSIEEKIKLSR